ncbi:AMP-binding protein, partial [Azospirillum sp. B506]|uniref:AMP-binding protein n=1 Tax=Azospirillum sp. B506 TaxID=137721 RepID=UPI0005B2E113
MISQTPQVWLDHQTYPTPDGLLLNWDAVEDLFPPGLLDDMFAAYEGLVRSLAGGDWDRPASLPLPAAQAAVRAAVNATAAPVDARQLHEAFFEHALAGPGRLALIAGDEVLSRRDLAERALRIAGLLRGRGVRDGDVVGIALPKGADQIAAVLGVVAAGAAYLPVAWDQPAARTRRICQRAGAGLVLTRAERLECAGWPDGVTLVDMAEAAGVIPLPAPVRGDHQRSAYIIFTSGSTGEPKGVEVSHAAAWNTVVSVNDRLGAGTGDRIRRVGS